MAKTTIKDVAALLESVQAQLAALAERVATLEAAGPEKPAAEAPPPLRPAAEPASPAPPPKQEITEDELIAISAALAAYLGVRVRIKRIRLLSSDAWARQGRVSIQASHYLQHN